MRSSLKAAMLIALALAAAYGAEPPDFATRVQPMLVKQGCFSGACHGAGSGQAGFKLSLLGYDAEADYLAIVNQYRGRRINLTHPEESLLLKKATMRLGHGGGQRFERDSPTHAAVLEWLRAGAPYQSREKRRIIGLEVEPSGAIADRAGRNISLKLTARFSDGSEDDVTPYALYSSNDEAVARVDAVGRVTVAGSGETGVTARYLGLFAVARVGLPFGGGSTELERLASGGSNFIDLHVNAKLRQLRLAPSERATDSEFLRRAYLDVIGLLPTVDEARRFLADDDARKREKLVDALLEKDEYAQRWSLWLLDLFRMSSKTAGAPHLEAFREWLMEGLRRDRPLSELVHEMLTAPADVPSVVVSQAASSPAGGGMAPMPGNQMAGGGEAMMRPDAPMGRVAPAVGNPAVHFLRRERDPKLMMELTTEALMGSRSRCAQCHDHPFDSWTQTEYHEFASFFVRVVPDEGMITLMDHGEIEHPKTDKPVAPGFPGESGGPAIGADRRDALADWLTSPENPYFARSFANRVWAQLMGRGLIEPVDDLSASNAATNPELLAALVDFFRGRLDENPSEAFSLKDLIRAIMASEAYQRGAVANDLNRGDDRFYSRALARPLDAYQLADAIAQITGSPNQYAGHPSGDRALDVSDSKVESYLLDVCGRCLRDGSCDAPSASAGGLRQMLHLINGPALNARIADPEGRLQRLLAAGAGPAEIAEEFYLAALSRPPSAAEKDAWLTWLAPSEPAGKALEDLVWALLNSRSFIFNR